MRLPRRTAALAIVALAIGACTDTARLPASTEAAPPETPFATTQVAAPTGPMADAAADEVAPATEPSPAATLPPTVTVVEPDFLVESESAIDAADLETLAALPGLEALARVATVEVQLSGPMADVTATAMVVDAADFRPLTPEVTAQSVGVWERLAAGEVVVRHDVAAELGLELGGSVLLTSPEGSRVARVGALAANGTPPVASLLLPWSLAGDLGVTEPNGVVVAVADDTVGDAAEALERTLEGAQVERREPPATQTAAFTAPSGSSSLEAFDYTDFGDGTIAIDPAWVSRYIEPVTLPGIATTRCHELMIPQLLAALEEVRALGLYDHFKPEQFGGCWVPRHIDWNPARPLSNHAWGTAVDFNTQENWLGDTTPAMDLRIVAVFEKWGFDWGGRWSRPDGMHFELARIVRPSS